MALYADNVARAFVNHRRVPRSHRLFPVTWSEHTAALVSYGDYFPIAIEATELFDGGYWVNETDYYPTDADKQRAGWWVNPYAVGKKRKSPTTQGHRASVESELRVAGYAPTDHTKQITTTDPNGRDLTLTLRLWEKR